MRKKERERFLKKATQLIVSFGAELHGDDEFILQTKAGKLTLHPTQNADTDGPGTVFARFDNPKAARRCARLQPMQRQVESPLLR